MGANSKTKSTTERAVDELRFLIFKGELGPGTDHLEGELADRLGMSRTPVREASRVLESQGLVEMRPRKGFRVSTLSPGDMRDVYEVLTELESLSVENAARMGYSERDLNCLGTAIKDMESALFERDLQAWADADDRFHTELVSLGRNSRIIAIAGMMIDQVRRARAVTLHMRPMPVKSNEDHRGVYDAIRRGDAAEARRIHHAHRTHAKDMLLSFLEKHHFLHL